MDASLKLFLQFQVIILIILVICNTNSLASAVQNVQKLKIFSGSPKNNQAKDDQIGTYLDSWIAFSFENIVQRRAKRREQGAALTV